MLNYIICGTAWMEVSHLSTTRITVFRRYIKQPTLTIYFSRTSQGHNALPRPGLEPGSSDSEPSALTTGPLGVPAIQLTTHVKSGTLCGRTVVRSYGPRVVHPNFFRLDGSPLFCIITGLRELRYNLLCFSALYNTLERTFNRLH